VNLILCALMTIALAAQEREVFHIDPAATSMTLQVGRGGIFAFAGHGHEVAVPAVAGSVTLSRPDLVQSTISLEFDAAALKVTGKGEPAEDVPEVQRVMLSDRVLDVQRYPTVTFRSSSISLIERTGDRMMLSVRGDLALHGVTRALTIPVTVRLMPDQLTAEGKATLRQTDFGIRPVTAGAGTVRVRDQVEVVFSITARRP
jgi:polyisoprenoid-binding protein YceI